VLVALVCVDFAQIMPHVTATNRQILLSVAVLVIVNSALGLAFCRFIIRRYVEASAGERQPLETDGSADVSMG